VDYAALQARVLASLASDSNDPIADSCGDFVNDAIHFLESAATEGWPWCREPLSVSLTADTDRYTFSTLSTTTSIIKILSARIEGDDGSLIPLEFRSIDEADSLYQSTNWTGQPSSFSVDGSTLILYPIPDGTYTCQLRIVFSEPDLSDSTDTPIMPSVFHRAIVDQTLAIMYGALQDDKREALFEQKTDTWVQRMRRYGNQYEASPKIRVREPL
jgi:hypothetical protein